MTTNPGLPIPSPPPLTDRDSLRGVRAARDLFWQNVLREILTSLSAAAAARTAPEGKSVDGANQGEEGDLFDGRLAVLTHGGERIPIADVFPLFACGINTGHEHRSLSLAVECTVFQIRTPDGQVFTLPLHEVRAFHALSPELMRQLEEMARRQSQEENETQRLARPFGFAAFTTMAGEQASAD